MFGWTSYGTMNFGSFQVDPTFSLRQELARRIVERINSDPRYVRYIVDRYGIPDATQFIQDCIARETELNAKIEKRLQRLERRFKPEPWMRPIEQGDGSKPEKTIFPEWEECSEEEFIPAIKKRRGGLQS